MNHGTERNIHGLHASKMVRFSQYSDMGGKRKVTADGSGEERRNIQLWLHRQASAAKRNLVSGLRNGLIRCRSSSGFFLKSSKCSVKHNKGKSEGTDVEDGVTH